MDSLGDKYGSLVFAIFITSMPFFFVGIVLIDTSLWPLGVVLFIPFSVVCAAVLVFFIYSMFKSIWGEAISDYRRAKEREQDGS